MESEIKALKEYGFKAYSLYECSSNNRYYLCTVITDDLDELFNYMRSLVKEELREDIEEEEYGIRVSMCPLCENQDSEYCEYCEDSSRFIEYVEEELTEDTLLNQDLLGSLTFVILVNGKVIEPKPFHNIGQAWDKSPLVGALMSKLAWEARTKSRLRKIVRLTIREALKYVES